MPKFNNPSEQQSQEKKKKTKRSQGVMNEEKLREHISNLSEIYTLEEMEALAFYLKRLRGARDVKNAANRYFDGMGYVEDYITNENAKNTFLTPKSNDSEVRVNVGTTEKKIETVKNELLSMNLKQEVRALNKDNVEIVELGQDFTDIVDITNHIEKDDDLWPEIIDDLLSQRAVFVRETDFDFSVRNRKDSIRYPRKELISGLKVFLGDISIPAYRFNEQPYICVVNVMSYETAQQLYGDNPRFTHVKPHGKVCEEYLGGALNFSFSVLEPGKVEVIEYISLKDDEYNLIINNVLMHPPKTNLPWKYNKYNIQMATLKSNSPDFAYGRPLAASAKTMQALSNETLRLLIRKFQQAIEPPLAMAKGGKIYSRDIFDPGSRTYGIKKNDFEPLVSHDGITNSEFSFYNLVEQKTEEFIGASDIIQGVSGNQEKSATQILTESKQFIKQLGLAVLAISRLKRDMTELRVYNILENYTKPISKRLNPLTQQVEEVFRSFSTQHGNLEKNKKGRKVIKFTDRDLDEKETEELFDFEELQRKKGQPVRFKFINTKTINSFIYYWWVNVISQEREGSALDKVIFQDQVSQAANIMQLTGRPINQGTIVEEFERKWNAKNFFEEQAPQQLGAEGTPEDAVRAEAEGLLAQMKGGGQPPMGEQVSRGLRGGQRRPVNAETQMQQ